MDCELIQPDLVAYHFGVIDDDARERVEKHLLTCGQCLADYVALKRDIETTESRPSRIAKERLRKAVMSEIGKKRIAWSWWERPLAVAVASAAVFAAVATAHVIGTSAGSAPKSLVASVHIP